MPQAEELNIPGSSEADFGRGYRIRLFKFFFTGVHRLVFILSVYKLLALTTRSNDH